MIVLTIALQCAAAIGALGIAFVQLRTRRAGRIALGIAALLGGIAMMAAIAVPFLTFFVAAVLAIVAVAVLLAGGDRSARTSRRLTVAALAAAIAAGAVQPFGLKVLMLPKADALPLETAVTALLKTYPSGTWFEGIAFGPDGTMYLAANSGENYVTGDKSRVHAQVIARSPDGSERVFFRPPQGATAGVMAFGRDGTMYMTGTGAKRGVWRIAPDGTGTLFAPLPHGAWPNGIDVGPDGKLYVADSALGAIWRVDPHSGAAEKAAELEALRARPYVALAPGANGIHFFGRDLFVTVSDNAWVLKFRLAGDGRLGAPAVVARGIPGDDFAIDSRGALYVTSHPYNTIVRVMPDGRRSIVAGAAQHIVGATDAVFGVRAGDRDTLYVVTDGGAFSGNLRAGGTLVAVKVPRA